MKWDGDPYKDLKWQIFDLLKSELKEEDALGITIKQLSDAIDKMIEKLLRSKGDK